MELFASPMACSLASHITALEAGLPVRVRFVENKKTDDGGDYYQISSKGYVPALRLDDGKVLNEGPSVLQYLADAAPKSGMAPAWGTLERYELIDTLNYLSTEVHKRIFANVFNPAAAEPTKEAAKALLAPTRSPREAPGRPQPSGRRQVHRRRCLSRDAAQLVRLCRLRPQEVAGARGLPCRAPEAPVGRQGHGDRDGGAQAKGGLTRRPDRGVQRRVEGPLFA
ncbi:MAG TPA: glutathione S-transferase N-terminal domain-containing protein [Reyranellaceae bacterium]|nr:glutathione S-transferase N-terminal domain-containing protein [Reyranellaceae bacterium]